MIAPHAGINFGGILRRHQVVGHGDGRQQDQDDDSESNDLRASLLCRMWCNAQPGAYHPHGNQHPTKIESQFHSKCQFYMRNECQLNRARASNFEREPIRRGLRLPKGFINLRFLLRAGE